MSGLVQDNIFDLSGVIAASSAGLSWQSVVTASSLTAEAGNGYPINTTSNTCTITLPSAASAGDQIIFVDYARNWGTNKIIIDSNGLNYQGDDDSYDVEYSTDGQSLHIVYSDATVGWIPKSDVDVSDVPVTENEEGIFGFGSAAISAETYTAVTNLVSNVGVVATDTTGVGTARHSIAACEYGGDKGIFGFGKTGDGNVSMTNLVSNAGVVATDTTGVGTARHGPAACGYDGNKGIFAYGDETGSRTAVSNLVSNAGVVATDVTGVGTARRSIAACEYGGDKGIFGFGQTATPTMVSITNLVSNAGVIATDTTGVGTVRIGAAACGYGGDKGIFAYGYATDHYSSLSNLVSNVGVVATDTTGVGTAGYQMAATQYGLDKGIFAYGERGGGQENITAVSNLVSNSGVVASDVTGVGTARQLLAACSFN